MHTLFIRKYSTHNSLYRLDDEGRDFWVLSSNQEYITDWKNFAEVRALWDGTCAEAFTIELVFEHNKTIQLHKFANSVLLFEVNEFGRRYPSKDRFLRLLFEAKTVRLVAPAEPERSE